jgi:hypothetical protein
MNIRFPREKWTFLTEWQFSEKILLDGGELCLMSLKQLQHCILCNNLQNWTIFNKGVMAHRRCLSIRRFYIETRSFAVSCRGKHGGYMRLPLHHYTQRSLVHDRVVKWRHSCRKMSCLLKNGNQCLGGAGVWIARTGAILFHMWVNELVNLTILRSNREADYVRHFLLWISCGLEIAHYISYFSSNFNFHNRLRAFTRHLL